MRDELPPDWRKCFKAYDVRGKMGEHLNDALARRIGWAYAEAAQPPGRVAVGYDARAESPGLAAAVVQGLNEAGVPTDEIGLCGTEMVYHAAATEPASSPCPRPFPPDIATGQPASTLIAGVPVLRGRASSTL